jgi:hypothetical protein
MDTTGTALLEHWTWAIKKGLMNRNTGGSLRSACAKVLPVLDDWETLDVRALNVDDALQRFVNLHSKEFKPASLEAYKKRFRLAVDSFLEYADDPAAWQPNARPDRVGPRSRNGVSKPQPSSPADEARSSVDPIMESGSLKGTNLHVFEYPIRDGVMARLTIPRDVTSSEMKRLMAWARTLAVDFELE